MAPLVSVAMIVNVVVPTPVGVPDSVLPASARPSGSVPWTENVYDPDPPVALNVWL